MKNQYISIEWAGDPEYIAKRNELIPIASQHADREMRTSALHSIDEWCRVYHRKMAELAHERLGCVL